MTDDPDMVEFEKVVFRSADGESFEIPLGLWLKLSELLELCQEIIDNLWHLEDERPVAHPVRA